MEVEYNRQCLLMSANSIVVWALYQNTIWGPSESFAATIAFGLNKVTYSDEKSQRGVVLQGSICASCP